MTDLLQALMHASDAAFQALNALSGRSWAFDMLVSLPVDNYLVKAGPVGACFAYAWFANADPAETQRRRRILIATLLSMCVAVVATKTLSNAIVVPRPLVQSQSVYAMDGAQLVHAGRLDYRAPLAGETRDRFERLERGEVVQNDLVSFPSDHAGLYVAMALGVLLACRLAGLVALGWTIFAILLSRIITGMHSPLDIVTGAALGAASLFAAQLVFVRWFRGGATRLADLTIRHQGLSAALLFLTLFEVTSTLVNTQGLIDWAGALAGAFTGRWA